MTTAARAAKVQDPNKASFPRRENLGKYFRGYEHSNFLTKRVWLARTTPFSAFLSEETLRGFNTKKISMI